MIGDKGREELAKNARGAKYAMFPFVDLNLDVGNPLYIMTRGMIYITYKPKYPADKRPFTITHDFRPGGEFRSTRIRGYGEYLEYVEREFNWRRLNEWAVITPQMFDAARRNPNMKIPCCVDIDKYMRDYKQVTKQEARLNPFNEI